VKTTFAAVLLAISLAGALAKPAYADCGDDGQPPCTGPVPTVDQVVALMTELTDPNRPALSKTDVVTPGFAPDEAATIDDHLNSLNSRGYLPYNFVVTDIEPAPEPFAGATVAAPKNWPYPSIPPEPIVLAGQGGHWLVTHDAAMVFLNKMWGTSRHRFVPFI